MFGDKGLKTPRSLNIGGRTIETKASMKYLGVMVDQDWTMKEHFRYAAEKDFKTINKLSRIMPNIGGLKEEKRRLYSSVIHSILLYVAPVWIEEICTFKAKKELANLQNIQKRIGIGLYQRTGLCLMLLH